MNFNKIKALIAIILTLSIILCGCGKKKDEVTYEIVDGKIVEVHSDDGGKKSDKPASGAGKDDADVPDNGQPVPVYDSGVDNPIVDDSSVSSGGQTNPSSAPSNSPSANQNTIESENTDRMKRFEQEMQSAVMACQDIYTNADKGSGINVSLSYSTIAEMITAIGNAGYSAIDSNGYFNMQCSDQLNQFGLSVGGNSDTSGTYFVVYSDGHMSGFQLYRENGTWYLLAMSSEIGEFRIYQDSKGRYAISNVSYTSKGWLIYSRDGGDTFIMVRVKPVDSTCRQLCQKYIEPVGYLENNLFTCTWSTNNIGPVDFNSLYAHLFGMYNGTEMLSSYNVRNYYKSFGGTRMYLIPTETFETVVQTYFNIDSSVLKSISDYSYSLGGYMFLGYNRDYYNVPPKTPTPEVVSYESNADGSITLTVDAVNVWYGTDRAFTHKLTVFPEGNGFKYVANELVFDDNNILPERKLSEMLDVEREKSGY